MGPSDSGEVGPADSGGAEADSGVAKADGGGARANRGGVGPADRGEGEREGTGREREREGTGREGDREWGRLIAAGPQAGLSDRPVHAYGSSKTSPLDYDVLVSSYHSHR